MSATGASIIYADAMRSLAKGERYNLGLATLNAIIARNGSPTPFLPASYLWCHPDFRLVYTADRIIL